MHIFPQATPQTGCFQNSPYRRYGRYLQEGRLEAHTAGLNSVLVLLLLLIVGLWPSMACAQTATPERSQELDQLFEQVLIDLLLDDPQATTQLGMHDEPALASLRSELTDASPAYELRDLYWAKAHLPRVQALIHDGLPTSQRVSAEVLEWYLDHIVRGEPFLYHAYPVNQIFGVQNALITLMTGQHPVEDVAGAEDYVARLSRFGVKIDQVLESLHLREAQGIVPPRFILEKVVAGMEGFLDATPQENVLYTAFRDKVNALEGVDEEVKADLLARAEHQVRETVYPAYDTLLAYLTDLVGRATDDAGAWKLPNGEAYYAHRLRYYTTTDYTPDEVHQMGLDEVARIEGELSRLLSDLGVEGETVLDQMRAFTGAPKQPEVYTDDEAGRKAVRDAIQAVIDEIGEGILVAFDRVPKTPLEVRRVPVFMQDTAPGGYYNPPALDGSRPGIFFLNQKWDPSGFTVAGVRPLAYHEGIPGHHYQFALQQEIEGLPLFRRSYLFFSSYAEGWALYAEQLAREYGFFPEPESQVAQLQSELYRAIRLVVDTGIHHKRWTREDAIDYMAAHLTWPRPGIESEVDRYIVWPGQATSYKVGMMKILELRERAREALGDDFDIRQFHNVVLDNGSMPLSILEALVEGWMEGK